MYVHRDVYIYVHAYIHMCVYTHICMYMHNDVWALCYSELVEYLCVVCKALGPVHHHDKLGGVSHLMPALDRWKDQGQGTEGEGE